MSRICRFALAIHISIALALTFGCSEDGILTDIRDGKTYRTVKVGKQTWMAENLNLKIDDSKCYSGKAENCEKYGRLYDWNVAMSVCPRGWHLPTNIEWDRLYRNADGTIITGGTESPYESETAGKYLKAKRGWNDDNGIPGDGEDRFRFTALPGGFGYSDGDFSNVGVDGNWWTASVSGTKSAYYRVMDYDGDYAYWNTINRANLFSVRCLRDSFTSQLVKLIYFRRKPV